MNKLEVNMLSQEDQMHLLDRFKPFQEPENTVQEHSAGKVPGESAFGAVFAKTFQAQLVLILKKAIKDIYRKGILSHDMSMALILLIRKIKRGELWRFTTHLPSERGRGRDVKCSNCGKTEALQKQEYRGQRLNDPLVTMGGPARRALRGIAEVRLIENT
ncbi:unnamed protein product [Caretta caretta]